MYINSQPMPKTTKTYLVFICTVFLTFCLNGLSFAQTTEEPDTVVLSDTLNYDDEKKESTFTGNVLMTRGEMTLNSDKLVIQEDDDGFQYGIATVNPGKLVFIRQENPEKFEIMEARGIRGEYDGKRETVTVIGQAIVTRFICGEPFDTIKGERVVYNQKNDTYQAFSGSQSSSPDGRVRSLAQPRAKSDAAVARCQKQQSKQ